MAQDGDTITYTYDGNTENDDVTLIPQQEDVSNVDEAKVDYCDGMGGIGIYGGGSGGRVENATIDVSNEDTLYIWVAGYDSGFGYGLGRYYKSSGAGGSSEISFSNTDYNDSKDEPFLVASGGGYADRFGEGDGARQSGVDGGGISPPKGGVGSNNPDGEGAIDDENRGIVSGGTTITGGGTAGGTNGGTSNAEIQISYVSTLSPPDPPSNLNASVQ